MYTNGLVGMGPDQTKLANEIKVSVNNNLAACLVKEGKWRKVVSSCTQV